MPAAAVIRGCERCSELPGVYACGLQAGGEACSPTPRVFQPLAPRGSGAEGIRRGEIRRDQEEHRRRKRCWGYSDAEARKRGEQTGLDTPVVHAVNDGY